MSNWHEHRIWCPHCGEWVPTCHTREAKSRYLVDLDNPTYLQCSTCPSTYPIDGDFKCPFHGSAVVKPIYATRRIVMQAGERIIRIDGDVLYVLQRTGTIVAARRDLVVGIARN
jgi:hypothetical protein